MEFSPEQSHLSQAGFCLSTLPLFRRRSRLRRFYPRHPVDHLLFLIRLWRAAIARANQGYLQFALKSNAFVKLTAFLSRSFKGCSPQRVSINFKIEVVS